MRKQVSFLALVVLVLTLTAGFVLGASPAGAHASFVQAITQFPVSTEQDIVMSVPHERGDDYWNVEIVVAMPDGWQAKSCVTKATWTCAIGQDAGRQVITWTKSGGPAEDETFRFRVRTASSIGSFSFPVIQVYSDDYEAAWIGDPGTDEPAPRLSTVAPTASTTTQVVTVPSHTPTTRPSVTPTTTAGNGSPTPTSPSGNNGNGFDNPFGTPTPTGTPGTLSPGANTFTSTTTIPGATTTVDPDAPTTTEAGDTSTTTDDGKDEDDDERDDDGKDEDDDADREDEDDGAEESEVALESDGGADESAAGPTDGGDGGGSAAPVVLGLVVLLGAAGAGGYVLMRRRAAAAAGDP